MPARTAAALDHASRPTGVEAPSATTQASSPRPSRRLKLARLGCRPVAVQLRFERHDGPFELLDLEVTRQRRVPHERYPRHVAVDDDGMQPPLLVNRGA